MNKIKITKDNGVYYLEVSSSTSQFMTIKIKLTENELLNLHTSLAKYL